MNQGARPEIDIYEEERPWGSFRRFTHNLSSTVKIITVNPNQSLSSQSHGHRAEFWRIISGTGTVEINDVSEEVKAGDEKFIPQGAKHRASAGPDGMAFMEIATGNFDEDDITRYDDIYGRAS